MAGLITSSSPPPQLPVGLVPASRTAAQRSVHSINLREWYFVPDTKVESEAFESIKESGKKKKSL